MNRRRFVFSTAGAAALASSAAAADDPARIAIIGLGGRGNQLMRQFAEIDFVEIAAVVDPDGNRAEEAAGWVKQKKGNTPKTTADMRTVFDDKNIDAVLVATTNHWHALTAIWAMQAGKDVYCEKPVSHNIFEGQQLIAASRKYDRMVQGGTQRRSDGKFRRAVQMIHDGVIVDLYLSKLIFPRERDSIGFKPHEDPPNWLNWDLWLGPAPEQPYHANLVHYNWHWFWDFGNGEMGNNGIHLVDISRWAVDQGLPSKIASWGGRWGYKDQAETPNTQNVRWEYADGSAIIGEIRNLYTSEKMFWDFFGTKGHMHIQANGDFDITLGRNKSPEPRVEPLPDVNHYRNFAEAVRSRARSTLNAEIRETVLSTALCHLGNIAYRVGGELEFDPKTERFTSSDEANKLLRRDYREPYVVPDEV
ncbi:MAG: Gfo/Idh/MocA family oxidoreductase [Planctomycetota bacterium]|nr:Gfo/Idh/MocA family oxidoreductase [Planctomycetota bacterium]